MAKALVGILVAAMAIALMAPSAQATDIGALAASYGYGDVEPGVYGENTLGSGSGSGLGGVGMDSGDLEDDDGTDHDAACVSGSCADTQTGNGPAGGVGGDGFLNERDPDATLADTASPAVEPESSGASGFSFAGAIAMTALVATTYIAAM